MRFTTVRRQILPPLYQCPHLAIYVYLRVTEVAKSCEILKPHTAGAGWLAADTKHPTCRGSSADDDAVPEHGNL